MRKIIWFNYYNRYSLTWISGLLFCIACFLLQKTEYSNLSIIFVFVWSYFGGKRCQYPVPDIPQILFLVPTSLEMRKEYVRRKFFLIYIIQILCGVIIINLFGIILYSELMFLTAGWSSICSSILILLMMCSCLYLYNFNSYFRVSETENIEGRVWSFIYKVVLLILGVLINHHMFEGQGLIYLAAYVLSFLVDYDITKKHLSKMINFYADYESSNL